MSYAYNIYNTCAHTNIHTHKHTYVCTVADWLESSACDAESAGSSIVRDNYCVGTLSKFFAHNYCSAILLHLRRRGV